MPVTERITEYLGSTKGKVVTGFGGAALTLLGSGFAVESASGQVAGGDVFLTPINSTPDMVATLGRATNTPHGVCPPEAEICLTPITSTPIMTATYGRATPTDHPVENTPSWTPSRTPTTEKPKTPTPSNTKDIPDTPTQTRTNTAVPSATNTRTATSTVDNPTNTATVPPEDSATATRSATATSTEQNPTNSPTSSATPDQPEEGQIKVVKYHDRNENAKREAGEEGLIWEFDVMLHGDKIGELITDGDGTRIKTIETGNYRVCEQDVDGWKPTTQDALCRNVVVDENELDEIFFGNVQVQPPAVEDTPVPTVKIAPPTTLVNAGNGGMDSSTAGMWFKLTGLLAAAGAVASHFGLNKWDRNRKTERVAIQ